MSTPTIHNLPAHAPALIGREQEIVEIRQLLDEPPCRLLTLVGPGGIGKTRLAFAIAEGFAASSADPSTPFADGVYFVPLQPVASTELLIPAIAAAMGVALAGNDPLAAQLRRHLRDKEVLLLLDNFEHLPAGVDLLVELIHGAPGVKALVTSRERLGVREEWLYPVHGLRVPAHAAEADLGSYSAIQLFSARARQIQPQFRWQQEREAVVAICRRVEGTPLAVELAASWLAVLPCTAIAARIGQGIDFLASPLRNLPERHRSMRAVFDQTWQLLGAGERAVFGRLSVFQGGFTLEAAQAVAGASLADLSALLFKSLIRQEPEGRYQIHELLRQYAAEKLAAAEADAVAAHRAFADYFLAFLRERRPQLNGPHQLRAVQEIGAEYENAHAALRWAVTQLESAEQAEAVQRAIASITSFYQISGRYLEGAEMLANALHHLERDGRLEICGAALAECLTCTGWLAIRLGRLPEAEAALMRALALEDELQLPPPQFRSGHAHMAYLFVLLVRGDYARASALGRELRDLAEQENQLPALATASYGSASAALAQGNYDEARELGKQALALTEALGIQFLPNHIHDVLGQVAAIQGDLPGAKRHFQAAFAVCAAFNARGGMAVHLRNLGDVARRQQLWQEAHAFFAQSLELYRSVGDQGGCAFAERGVAIALAHAGNMSRARGHFHQALAAAVATQSVRTLLSVMAGAGSFIAEREQAGHDKAGDNEAGHHKMLGQRVLRAVAQHPACDRMTREEALAGLQRSGAEEQGAADETLEELLPLLQAELAAAPEISLPPQTATAHSLVFAEPLTEREAEVLRLLVQGRTNQEIAGKLIISVGTVKAHTSNIYRKLDVTTRGQAVARAHELGLLN